MDLKTGLLVLLSIALITATPITKKKQTREASNYRLNVPVTIDSYDVKLKLDKNFNDFTGSVVITLHTTEATKTIKLNALNLVISKEVANYLLKVNDVEKGINPVEIDTNFETILVTANEEIPKGAKVELTIKEFAGILGNDMRGFYKSIYGENKPIATTQFEPTYARRAFPCFDEPSLKAEFNFEITYPKGYNVLFNTESTGAPTDDGDYLKSTFAKTPKMSTYLIAFVISDFEDVSENYKDKPFNVWARADAKSTADHAKTEAVALIGKLEAFTGVEYELKKMDQIAIPDFQAGAMENWGLATYRETALLFDAKEGTKKNKQRVTSVIAHEFAHMWFGDLVTLDWWSNTWLNEGFATFFESYTSGEVHDDWEMNNQFVIQDLQPILLDDALTNAKPLSSVEGDVNTLTEINDKFSSISYSKGGSVIRMMENFVGHDKFKAALTKYLNANAHQNADPSKLLSAFTDKPPEGSGKFTKSVEDIMQNWVFQSGYPVLTVKKNAKNVEISQERFLFTKPTDDTQSTIKWYVPISYTTSDTPDFTNTLAKKWLSPEDKTVTITDALKTDTTAIILNVKSTGYYRVNYDDALWNNIITFLKTPDKIDKINRAQIVDDSMNLARAGILPYKKAFEIISFLSNEVDYFPWYSAFNTLNFLRMRLGVSSTAGTAISNHISTQMKKLYASVKFDVVAEKHIDTLKQVLALEWACELNNNDCVSKAKTHFEKVKKGESIPPEFRSIVYCSALRHDKANYEVLFNKLKATTLASEIMTLITALGCTKDKTQLETYLKESINDKSTVIRPQDASYVFNAVLTGNPEGVDIALEFLINNWQDIQKRYGGMNALGGLLTSLSNRITTTPQLLNFIQFIMKTDLGEAKEQADSAMENLASNMQWALKNEAEILTIFKSKGNGNSGDGNNSGNIAGITACFLVIASVMTRLF